jgi:hypothetical protein
MGIALRPSIISGQAGRRAEDVPPLRAERVEVCGGQRVIDWGSRMSRPVSAARWLNRLAFCQSGGAVTYGRSVDSQNGLCSYPYSGR